MSRDRHDCVYNDSDEDCYKCVKHGYIFTCAGCKDYKNIFGRGDEEDIAYFATSEKEQNTL